VREDEAAEHEESSCLLCDRPDIWDNMIGCQIHEDRWYHCKCVGVPWPPPNGTENLSAMEIYLLI
jgi:hypothetical protein